MFLCESSKRKHDQLIAETIHLYKTNKIYSPNVSRELALWSEKHNWLTEDIYGCNDKIKSLEVSDIQVFPMQIN